jgi:hypothetical protein
MLESVLGLVLVSEMQRRVETEMQMALELATELVFDPVRLVSPRWSSDIVAAHGDS